MSFLLGHTFRLSLVHDILESFQHRDPFTTEGKETCQLGRHVISWKGALIRR